MKDIDELDRLHAAATAGEWAATHDRNAQPNLYARDPDGFEHWIAILPHQCLASLEALANANTAAIVALHNAWPEVSARLRAAEVALARISEIRNSIVGCGTVNWSEHVYPLVAALNEAGHGGAEPDAARVNFGTLLGRASAAETEVERLRGALRGVLATHAGSHSEGCSAWASRDEDVCTCDDGCAEPHCDCGSLDARNAAYTALGGP